MIEPKRRKPRNMFFKLFESELKKDSTAKDAQNVRNCSSSDDGAKRAKKSLNRSSGLKKERARDELSSHFEDPKPLKKSEVFKSELKSIDKKDEKSIPISENSTFNVKLVKVDKSIEKPKARFEISKTKKSEAKKDFREISVGVSKPKENQDSFFRKKSLKIKNIIPILTENVPISTASRRVQTSKTQASPHFQLRSPKFESDAEIVDDEQSFAEVLPRHRLDSIGLDKVKKTVEILQSKQRKIDEGLRNAVNSFEGRIFSSLSGQRYRPYSTNHLQERASSNFSTRNFDHKNSKSLFKLVLGSLKIRQVTKPSDDQLSPRDLSYHKPSLFQNQKSLSSHRRERLSTKRSQKEPLKETKRYLLMSNKLSLPSKLSVNLKGSLGGICAHKNLRLHTCKESPLKESIERKKFFLCSSKLQEKWEYVFQLKKIKTKDEGLKFLKDSFLLTGSSVRCETVCTEMGPLGRKQYQDFCSPGLSEKLKKSERQARK